MSLIVAPRASSRFLNRVDDTCPSSLLDLSPISGQSWVGHGAAIDLSASLSASVSCCVLVPSISPSATSADGREVSLRRLKTDTSPIYRIDRSKHTLLDIITIALCGIICGADSADSADSWVDIELFGKCKEDWFRTFLELPNGIPSHDTFGDVFARLDPEQFQRCFMEWVQAEWVQAVAQVTQGEVVAIDGKTVRRSHDRTLGKKAIHMVNVWPRPMAWRWARPRWTRSPMK